VTITKNLVSEIKSCVGTATNKVSTYIFVATDGCGNISTGTATFTVVDNVAPVITAPSNLTVSCGQSIATLVVDWLDNYSVVEACQSYTVTNNYNGLVPNLCGGSQTVTWTVTDGCGATGTATAQIVVSADATAPVFSNCPVNMTVNADVDVCNANVIYSTPIATDCNGSVTVLRTGGIASGSTFPLGITTITFSATDACGNTGYCTFNITVVDSDVPSLTCPTNEVAVCADGTCKWTSTGAVTPIGIENCPGAAITYTISGATTGSGSGSASGTVFNLGISTVTYTITAANGQSSSCSFVVNVKDCTKPTITCCTVLKLLDSFRVKK
jgi:hypothetical protein